MTERATHKTRRRRGQLPGVPSRHQTDSQGGGKKGKVCWQAVSGQWQGSGPGACVPEEVDLVVWLSGVLHNLQQISAAMVSRGVPAPKSGADGLREDHDLNRQPRDECVYLRVGLLS